MKSLLHIRLFKRIEITSDAAMFTSSSGNAPPKVVTIITKARIKLASLLDFL
jgi:hypothetical protein